MRIREPNHSAYQVVYHIVWGTKYRRKLLEYYVRSELIKALYHTQRKYPTWYIHNINTDDDHVHLLIEFPPTYSISSVVQKLKAEGSGHLRKKFKFIDRIYEECGVWSVGYFVSTVGLNEEQIRKYIDRQGKRDKAVDITSELS